MLEILQKLQKKLQGKFRFIVIIFMGLAAHAQPCEECTKVRTELDKVTKQKESYIALKEKNEAYLRQPNVSSGAAIKVKSNIVLLSIKIETAGNLYEEQMLQMKKLGDCKTCPVQAPGKS